MTIITPTQLVDEFKKSGEFDRLRRELLTQFQQSDNSGSFTSRIEDIARQRLLSDQKLQYMAPDAAHTELMKEMDRYPIVERAAGELQMLADPSFVAGIQNSVQKILREDRDKTSPASNMDDDAKPPSIVTSQPLNGAIPPIMAEVASATVIQAPKYNLGSQSHQTTTSALITVTQMSGEQATAEPLVTSNDPHTSTHLGSWGASDSGSPNSKIPSLNSSDWIDS